MKLEDTESRLNTKLAAANENLVSARNDVTRYEQKIKDLEDSLKQKEKLHYDLKGEMAGKGGTANVFIQYTRLEITIISTCNFTLLFDNRLQERGTLLSCTLDAIVTSDAVMICKNVARLATQTNV